MPRPGCTWAARSDWLNFYKITKPDGSVVTYGDDRTWSGDNPENDVWPRAAALINQGIQQADRVLIAGSGCGFLIETLKMSGLNNVWGLDSSPFVHSKKGEVAPGQVIVNGDLTNPGSLRNALQAGTGFRTFNWLISESVLESYDDNDIGIIVTGAESLLINQVPVSHIIHIVYPPPFTQPGVFNEKTMAQWKAIRPTHTWMNAEGYGVA